MADDALTVAKEITLSALPQVTVGGDTSPKNVGEKYGELFKVILKQVVQGINEANK